MIRFLCGRRIDRKDNKHRTSLRSVSTLLLSSMILMAAFIFVMGAMAYSQVQAIKAIIIDTLARGEARNLTSRIRIESLLLSDLSQEYVLHTPLTGKSRIRVTFDEASRRIEELFLQATKSGPTGDLDMIKNVRENGVHPFVVQAGILMDSFDQEGQYGPQTQKALMKLVALRGPMLDFVQSMEDVETDRLDQARKRAKIAAQRALWIILGGGGFIFLMAIAVSVINLRRILIPLGDIQSAVESLAEGQYNTLIKIRRDDEFGELARVFNNMAAQLQGLIGGLERRVAERTQQLSVSNNQLQQEVLVRKEAEEGLQKAFNELKLIQAQLIQSEKMAGIGVLAAGVAHEINNPLGFINSNLMILKKYIEVYDKLIGMAWTCEEIALTDEFRKYAEEAKFKYIQKDAKQLLQETLDGVNRISCIVKELKAFSNDSSRETILEPLKVESVIEGILSIVNNQIKYKAELVKEYGKTTEVLGSEIRLGQVFINLLVNAAQAIEKHGRITISTNTANGYTYVKVADTGVGIARENIDKIFDAFFTTKPVGSGTGLGLSVSYEIIQQHNGQISVESELGKGTTLIVKLPVYKG